MCWQLTWLYTSLFWKPTKPLMRGSGTQVARLLSREPLCLCLLLCGTQGATMVGCSSNVRTTQQHDMCAERNCMCQAFVGEAAGGLCLCKSKEGASRLCVVSWFSSQACPHLAHQPVACLFSQGAGQGIHGSRRTCHDAEAARVCTSTHMCVSTWRRDT